MQGKKRKSLIDSLYVKNKNKNPFKNLIGKQRNKQEKKN